MTPKGILRYLIAIAILIVVLSIALPFFGIPRQVIWAPPLAYMQASGKTTGYILSRDTSPTANPFHVGDLDYFVRYQYRAPAIGKNIAPGTTAVYQGHAQVEQSFYNSAVVGQQVSVKLDPSDPIISGVSEGGGGRNGDGQASIISQWILWDLAILVVAYPFAMLLERVMLRESY